MAKKKIGLIIALGAIAGSAVWVYKKYDSIKSMYQKVSLFKGERIEFDTFDGEAVAGMFSGLLVDLSQADFTEKEVYLDLYGFCSGIKVLIPKDVEVILEGTNKASGVNLDQDEDIVKTRTLFINYNLTASGLSISDNIDECTDDSCCSDEDCCKDDDCCKEDDCCEGDDDCCEGDDDCCKGDDCCEDEDNSLVDEDDSLEDEDEDDSSDDEDEDEEEEVEPMVLEEIIEDEPSWENDVQALNSSAQELDQAAAEVEEAIEQLIDGEEIPFEKKHFESEDEFFEQ